MHTINIKEKQKWIFLKKNKRIKKRIGSGSIIYVSENQ